MFNSPDNPQSMQSDAKLWQTGWGNAGSVEAAQRELSPARPFFRLAEKSGEAFYYTLVEHAPNAREIARLQRTIRVGAYVGAAAATAALVGMFTPVETEPAPPLPAEVSTTLVSGNYAREMQKALEDGQCKITMVAPLGTKKAQNAITAMEQVEATPKCQEDEIRVSLVDESKNE